MNKKQKEKYKQLLVDARIKPTGVEKILAMLELALVKEPPKSRIKKPSVTMTIEKWEAEQGQHLGVRHMADWVDRNNFDPRMITQLIEEFRIDMTSKGKEYADFRAAFQNYFNKGYLSLKPDNPRIKRAATETNFDRRGVSL